MSLQTIINNAVSIQIDRRKLAGQTISRSGQVRISSVASNIPWSFVVQMHPALKYSTNRALVEQIDYLDRVFTETINIGNSNPGLAYITQYQGDLSSSQINAITVTGYNALLLELNVSAIGGLPADYIFRRGDYLQLDGVYKYPYTTTADVQRGSSSTVLVPLNRPFIPQSGYITVGAGIQVGPDVTWNVVMSKKPGYQIAPHDRLEFLDSFELVEVIED